MPILALILSLLGGAVFWYVRNRGAAGTIDDVAELALEAKRAPRRIRFKQNAKIHPIEQCENLDELIAAYSASFLELDSLPSQDAQQTTIQALGRAFNLTLPEAEELLAYGRWLMGECGTANQATARIGKRLFKLSGGASFAKLTPVLNEIASQSGTLSPRQQEALVELQRDFKIN